MTNNKILDQFDFWGKDKCSFHVSLVKDAMDQARKDEAESFIEYLKWAEKFFTTIYTIEELYQFFLSAKK